MRAKLHKAAPAIVDHLIALAEDGDVQAMRLLIERILPAWRPIDRYVTLPLGPDLAAASGAVLAAIGTGRLTPAQAATIAATIGALARTAELLEFEKRLSTIESDLNERKQS